MLLYQNLHTTYLLCHQKWNLFYFRLIFSSHTNQSINSQLKSIYWLLYLGKIGLKSFKIFLSSQKFFKLFQVVTEAFNTTSWRITTLDTTWKVYKYGVFSGPYFHAFGLNMERYSVYLRIQFECGKIWARKNSVFGHFSRD